MSYPSVTGLTRQMVVKKHGFSRGAGSVCGPIAKAVEPLVQTPPRTPFDRLLILVGSLGPLGFMPASGTVTVALVGIPLFWAMHRVPLAVYVPTLAAFTLASVWIHQRGDRILGAKDSGILVWDEIAGFLIAVIGVPFTWKIALVAFLLERVLDIAKIWPARAVEDHWPGGWGVVGDDVIAGIYTLAILHSLVHLFPGQLL